MNLSASLFFWEVNTSSENHHDFFVHIFWKKVTAVVVRVGERFCIKTDVEKIA